jgi:trimethylamine--corrinoid protein Co-methyltransferase
MSRRRELARERAAARRAAIVAPAGLRGGRYKPLDDTEVVRIVDAAKTVLERTGIEVLESPCREVFRKAGCRVDEGRNRVYIDSALVERALETAAPEVLLAGRAPGQDLNLGGQRVYMGTGGSAVNVVDVEGAFRQSTLADNYHIGRLVDRLDNIHFYMRPVVSRDIPPEALDINQYYACLAATPKHVMANAYRAENVARLRQLGEMLAGGSDAMDRRPVLSFVACWTVSPLRYAEETVAVVDAIVEHDMPLVLSSAPQAGATSPATLAGTLVQIIAEQLSGFVYINLLRPGHPTIMGCVPAQADLRTGSYTGGSAEGSLMNAACAQIAQHLQIPLYNSTGISEAKLADAQAGSEKAVTGLAAGLAGANYIHHSAGFLESMLTVAYEQYVIDNDINGQVMRMVRGIEVTDEALAVDVIDEVCAGEGHYLSHPQTMARMNTEYLYPSVMDRANREIWSASGGLDVREVARTRAREILAEHWPKVIPSEVDTDIRRRFEILLPESEMRRGEGVG